MKAPRNWIELATERLTAVPPKRERQPKPPKPAREETPIPKPYGQYTELLMLRLTPKQMQELQTLARELHGPRTALGGVARRLLADAIWRKQIELLRQPKPQRNGQLQPEGPSRIPH